MRSALVPSHGRKLPLLTSSAALSGAAVRMLRTAAGRRALQVALLVGGVLVIGLLCGERAYAADGVRAYGVEGVRASADSTAGRSVSGQRLLVRPDVDASAARGQSDAHALAVRKRPSDSAQLVRGVGERAVRVADGTRESVGRELVKVQASLPPPPKAPRCRMS